MLEAVHKGMRNRPATAQMAQTEGVVAVNQDAGIFAFPVKGALHTNPVRFHCCFCPPRKAEKL
jgi:hypothetical protein